MTGAASGSLALRLAAFALLVVFFQIGVVSEVPVFGVNADVSALLVAFIGLMCGSTVGAACGFAVGLLVDLALLQTLGLTSLVFTLIGYWCGRLRELRDPQAALTPLLVGAGASAVSLVGYSLMEFMLGVDAPVSFELRAPDRARGPRQRDRRPADVGADAPRRSRARCPTIPAAGGAGARTRPVA